MIYSSLFIRAVYFLLLFVCFSPTYSQDINDSYIAYSITLKPNARVYIDTDVNSDFITIATEETRNAAICANGWCKFFIVQPYHYVQANSENVIVRKLGNCIGIDCEKIEGPNGRVMFSDASSVLPCNPQALPDGVSTPIPPPSTSTCVSWTVRAGAGGGCPIGMVVVMMEIPNIREFESANVYQGTVGDDLIFDNPSLTFSASDRAVFSWQALEDTSAPTVGSGILIAPNDSLQSFYPRYLELEQNLNEEFQDMSNLDEHDFDSLLQLEEQLQNYDVDISVFLDLLNDPTQRSVPLDPTLGNTVAYVLCPTTNSNFLGLELLDINGNPIRTVVVEGFNSGE